MISFDPKRLRIMLIMGNAVLAKAVMIGLLGWGGYKLDKLWSTSPWLMFLGIVVGMSLGLWYIMIVARRVNSEN